MEQHLRVCDRCLETYLSALLPGDEAEAGMLLSPDFPARTVARLQEEVGDNNRVAKRRVNGRANGNLSSLLQYYAVAAAITLLLMTGGWFDLLGKQLPQTIDQRTQQLQRVEDGSSFRWSDKMMEAITRGIDALTGVKEDDENG